MKGDRKRRKHGFQRGHASLVSNNNVNDEATSTHKIVPFQRLTQSEFDVMQNRPFEEPRTLEEHLADSHSAEVRLLRPKKEPKLKVEENVEIFTEDR